MTSGTKLGAGAAKRAFVEVLYRKYHEALTRFLGRQHFDREEVADIVQETYCRMHSVRNVEEIRFPQAFLFRTAFNLARNKEKAKVRHRVLQTVELDQIEIASREPAADRIIEAEEELAIVRAAIRELHPKCRRAFVMNRFENLTYGEVAKELGVTVSMVEKYVSHALAHIKRRLDSVRLVAGRVRVVK